MQGLVAVVVHDPRGELPIGEFLEENALRVAEARGVVLLPVEPDLIRRGGVSGWALRFYGQGWSYSSLLSGRGSLLVLQMTAGFPGLSWVARLSQEKPDAPPSGSLRITSDSAQAGASAVGLMPENGPCAVTGIGHPDEQGGWIIGGKARVMLPSDTNVGLQLYGHLAGARVSWFAASQTRG